MARNVQGARRLVGMRIGEARRARGLRSSDVARTLGVPRSAISDWEGGRWSPNLPLMWSLCALLEIPLQDILGPPEGWRPTFHSEAPEVSNSDRAEVASI